jgi:oxygen-independent coproporphyrinogen-3 oxidase
VRVAMDSAVTALARAHFHRYEVSNFAQPGSECRHNLSCWRGGDYLGFGPSAASRVGRARRRNRSDVRAYNAAVSAGRMPPASRENVDEDTDASERIAFAFRLSEGVDPAKYAGTTASAGARLERWKAALETCVTDGLVSKRGVLWVPTPRGIQFADAIAERLLPG